MKITSMNEQKNHSASASNTLAENTEHNALTLRVDWVSASFSTAMNLHQVCTFLGLSQLENLEVIAGSRYGFAGYDMTYRIGSMEILYDQKETRFLINFSGQACREYELMSNYDFVTFFALLANVYATYTRIDIAIDDFKNIYDVNKFRKSVMEKRVVTRLKEWGDSKRGLIAEGGDVLTMDNFYLGSSSSRYFINVYDKKLERQNKGLEVEYDTWTRTEIRFKNAYAQQIVLAILTSTEDFGEIIFAFLNEKIAILTKESLKNDSNKARLAKDYNNHSRWWRTFLNTTKKQKLTVYKPELPLMATQQWLLKQVATSLATFEIYYDYTDFEKFIQQLILTGRDRLQDKHLQKIENQRVIDQQIEQGEMGIEWFKTELQPTIKKTQKLTKLQQIEEKDKKRAKLMSIYYETKHQQDEREKEKSQLVRN